MKLSFSASFPRTELDTKRQFHKLVSTKTLSLASHLLSKLHIIHPTQMAVLSSTLPALRSLLREILPVFGPLGRDLAVRGARGEVVLTNRGGAVLRSRGPGEGPGVALVVKLARAKADFSVSFVIAVCALCEVVVRRYGHMEAIAALRTVEVQFESLFDARELCNEAIPVEEMRGYIAVTGLAGKLSPSLRTEVIAAATDLIGANCSISALKAAGTDFPIHRLTANLQVAKNTIVLKGACKRLVYSKLSPGSVLILPSSNIPLEGPRPGGDYVELQRRLEAVLLEYKVNLVVCEGELEPWVRDLLARLEGTTGFAVRST